MADKLGVVLGEYNLRYDELQKLIARRGVTLSGAPGVQELITKKQAELRKLSDWVTAHYDEVLVPKVKPLEQSVVDCDVRISGLSTELYDAHADRDKASERQLEHWQLMKQASRVIGSQVPPRPDRPQKSFKGQIQSHPGVAT